jgi:hypothetical protein
MVDQPAWSRSAFIPRPITLIVEKAIVGLDLSEDMRDRAEQLGEKC